MVCLLNETAARRRVMGSTVGDNERARKDKKKVSDILFVKERERM